MTTIVASLDRPGRRWVLALLATMVATFSARRLCRVWWRDGAWFHTWDGGEFFNHRIIFKPARYVESSLDIFFRGYTPKAGDTVIDIGAGVGTETFVFRRLVGSTGKVVAVEAHPATFDLLTKLVAANQWSNVSTVNVAVTSEVGPVRMSTAHNWQINALSEDGDTNVDGTTLARLLSDLGLDRVDFLKMNIEGAEMLALEGLGDSAQRIHHMCVSCHDFLGQAWGRTHDDVVRRLRELGYHVSTVNDDPRPWANYYVYASMGRTPLDREGLQAMTPNDR